MTSIEALKKLISPYFMEKGVLFNDINDERIQMYLQVYKSLNALDVIIKKDVDVFLVSISKTKKEYDNVCDGHLQQKLTKGEFNLIKEVLSYE